jgi:hypothetical protein
VQVKFQVGVVDSSGTEKFTNQFDKLFENRRGWGLSKLMRHDELVKPESHLLIDDTLTLSFEVNED